jgi:hypothetical protein
VAIVGDGVRQGHATPHRHATPATFKQHACIDTSCMAMDALHYVRRTHYTHYALRLSVLSRRK